MFLPLPRLVKAEKPQLTERVFTKLNPFYKSSQHIAHPDYLITRKRKNKRRESKQSKAVNRSEKTEMKQKSIITNDSKPKYHFHVQQRSEIQHSISKIPKHKIKTTRIDRISKIKQQHQQ
ncbi:unnamed protein product [Citrullus colocynthis]|uniref:Uncharacterized protein n=1 Tax=Citrullus colocynthis TaxID=252529 RepID=A0ABP0YG15_9ROSI